MNLGLDCEPIAALEGYFEVYNQPNVKLVDITETPIERITSTGIKTSDAEYEFDIIIYATGFDAITGAFDRIDIRGVDGVSLKEKWQNGPQTFLGILVDGFPNMLMVMGPHAGLGNFPRYSGGHPKFRERCETVVADQYRELSLAQRVAVGPRLCRHRQPGRDGDGCDATRRWNDSGWEWV